MMCGADGGQGPIIFSTPIHKPTAEENAELEVAVAFEAMLIASNSSKS